MTRDHGGVATAAVSVIIPTYQSSSYVGATITSLLRQSYASWECIVTDDASDDDTVDRVRVLVGDDPRFRIFANEQRLGARGNWNRGLGLATSDLVKVLCADDLLHRDCLGLQVAAMSRHPEAALSCGPRDIVDAAGHRILRARGWHGGAELVSGRDALRRFVRTGTNVFGEPSFVLFRTDALRARGGFSDRWNYLIDVAAYVDVLDLGPLAPVHETVGAFRVHGASWSAELTHEQASETRAFIRHVGRMPGVDSGSLATSVGLARATLNAAARRTVYGYAGLVERTRGDRQAGQAS